MKLTLANHKLRRLHFIQGGQCFYCRQDLNLDEATLDHIIPKSLGGSDSIDNLACCCKSINQLFANMPVKIKLDSILQWQGAVSCPKD